MKFLPSIPGLDEEQLNYEFELDDDENEMMPETRKKLYIAS